MIERFMDWINRTFNKTVYLDGFAEPSIKEKKVTKYIYESVFPDEFTMQCVQKVINETDIKPQQS